MQQDKQVIYNEIIDVLKSILFIFMQKHDKILNKSGGMRAIKGLNPEMSL